jgi:hypothetical protein
MREDDSLTCTNCLAQSCLRGGAEFVTFEICDSCLDYLKQIKRDDTLAQDRFFAYCDPRLIDQVWLAAAKGMFAPEFGCAFFHKGGSTELETG